ncbi:MAG: DNA double-strand break repair nuclease NurA [Candidatus Heimdallarchaeota archaeon]|nr:MAG: DNA double-strand break repair nuclease NurA [Candidatus Heimdallarchaeota archaeon]
MVKLEFQQFLKQIQKVRKRAVKQAEKSELPSFHEFSYGDYPPKMIALDGSNRWIWYSPDINARIAVIRAAAVVYEYQPLSKSRLVLKYHTFKDIPVLIAPNNLEILNFDPEIKTLHQEIKKALGPHPTTQGILNQLRELEELKLAEDMALKYSDSLIVMDGALTIIQVKQIENAARNLREACIDSQNTLIGVSKRNTTRRLKSNLTDEALVRQLTKNDSRMLYTEISEIPKGKQVYPPLGQTFLTKLHPQPIKSFRVDIVPSQEQKLETIFSHLAYYSKVDTFPGYPFPLVDAHNIAAMLRRVPDMFNNELVEAGAEIGINEEELFQYLITHEKMERDPFHRHLDDITK